MLIAIIILSLIGLFSAFMIFLIREFDFWALYLCGLFACVIILTLIFLNPYGMMLHNHKFVDVKINEVVFKVGIPIDEQNKVLQSYATKVLEQWIYRKFNPCFNQKGI